MWAVIVIIVEATSEAHKVVLLNVCGEGAAGGGTTVKVTFLRVGVSQIPGASCAHTAQRSYVPKNGVVTGGLFRPLPVSVV